VTPPHPEGSGLSGRFRSLTGKLCPQHVDGSVYIGIGLIATQLASGHCLGYAVSCGDMSAPGACLRGVTGVDCDYCPSGALSLGGEDPQEQPPSRVEDDLVQPGFSRGPIQLVDPISSQAWLRASARCAAAIRVLAAVSRRGFGTCTPSLVVRNEATPKSRPTATPVTGSGCAGTSSQERVTNQRGPSRFTLIVFTIPRTAGAGGRGYGRRRAGKRG
jgi:hypothetical protein